MMAEARSRKNRKADTLTMLATPAVDVWVARGLGRRWSVARASVAGLGEWADGDGGSTGSSGRRSGGPGPGRARAGPKTGRKSPNRAVSGTAALPTVNDQWISRSLPPLAVGCWVPVWALTRWGREYS